MGWFILFGIVAVILILLLCSVTVRFEYGEDIRLRVSYLCFTIFKYPAVKKKNKKKDKAVKAVAKAAIDETAEHAEEEISENKSPQSPEKSAPEKAAPAKKKQEKKEKPKGDKKQSLGDIFELAKLILDSLGKPLKKLLKRSKIYHLRVNIICGGEDAAQAALNFGKTNILVGNALGWLGTFFTLTPPDDIHIDVNFYSEETVSEASLVLKTSVLTALAFLFTVLGRAVRYYLKNPKAAAAVGRMK